MPRAEVEGTAHCPPPPVALGDGCGSPGYADCPPLCPSPRGSERLFPREPFSSRLSTVRRRWPLRGFPRRSRSRQDALPICYSPPLIRVMNVRAAPCRIVVDRESASPASWPETPPVRQASLTHPRPERLPWFPTPGP